MKNLSELSENPGFAGRMAQIFIDSKLTPVIIFASLMLGILAIVNAPP